MSSHDLSRRDFIRATGAGMLAFEGGQWLSGQEAGQPGSVTRLSEHLLVYHGPINVGMVRDGPKALLIDCGDARVRQIFSELDIASVERVLFTHHHRDQACGAPELVAMGARLAVPAPERPYFENVAAYWTDPRSRWHIYSQHPHHLMLAESVPVAEALEDGQPMRFGPAILRVLATPGHTDGSISLVVDVDGRRVVFCGDALYDQGQLWDLHSLQKGTVTSDYHGFLGARQQLAQSLRRIEEVRPERLVPSHGRVMEAPAEAIERVLGRLEVCYDKYVATAALRHYFPKMFAEYAGKPDHMPIRPGKPVPDCLKHFGTTWLLVSKDKAAWVMDCGSPRVIQWLQELQATGEIGAVEGLWVTHYHDDHVDAIAEFQKAFDCPCIADRHVAEVISDPLAWRLPCISPSRARVDRVTEEGESWAWHEFRLTAFHLPGQTLYHGGLLVEGQGLKMFFVGDSFTMAGMDDYCMHNRVWLGPGVGFDRCLALIEKLQPTHLFNCHVRDAFAFTPDELRFMRANLAEREKLYGELVPWDHPNYAMDEPWVRAHPYEQACQPGSEAAIEVVVTNHSAGPRTLQARPVPPPSWRQPAGPWASTEIPAKSEGRLRLAVPIPAGAQAGRHVIAIDIRYDTWDLPQFTEAILVI